MEDRHRLGWAIVAGAALGGALGFLFFTERGRRVRAQLESQVDDVLSGVGKLQDLATLVGETAASGWQQVQHLTRQVAEQAGDSFETRPGSRPH